MPQRAVLSPFLFLVYIDDLLHELERTGCCSPFAYADDLSLVPVHEDQLGRRAVRGLDRLSAWAYSYGNRWRVSINASKSRVVLFTKQPIHPALLCLSFIWPVLSSLSAPRTTTSATS